MKKIGFFPGSFKPLHRGHYQSIINMRKCVDELHVLMSVKNRGELSGLASRQYVENYIAPTLSNVVFHYIDGSPVGEMYKMVEKLDVDGSSDVYLFAGVEDAGARYRPEALQKSFPNLVKGNNLYVEILAPVSLCRTGCRGVKRISGTETRRYLTEGNRVKLCEALPDVSLVQNNISEIIRLFTS